MMPFPRSCDSSLRRYTGGGPGPIRFRRYLRGINRYCRAVDLRGLRYFIAACEERNLGRAAERLHMTQPPLSRAMRGLEHELGAKLLTRSARGVSPTAAGRVLYDEARAIVDRADRVHARVREASTATSITVGLLADTAEHLAPALIARFSGAHPDVSIRFHEADLADPTGGLSAGLADVALTRSPFDEPGITTRVIGTEAVGVVVRDEDPLAGQSVTSVAALAGRDWVRLADHASEAWRAYWSGATSNQNDRRPASRTIRECLQSVLWNGSIAIAPLSQQLPDGLTIVPVNDREPNLLLLAWRRDRTTAMVRSFIDSALKAP